MQETERNWSVGEISFYVVRIRLLFGPVKQMPIGNMRMPTIIVPKAVVDIGNIKSNSRTVGPLLIKTYALRFLLPALSTRAAGCELLGNLDNAKSAILAEVEAELDRPETQEES